MSNELTPEELDRAKRWAAMQTPPVTVELKGPKTKPFLLSMQPLWVLGTDCFYKTDHAAWSALALALRPVFASIAPIIREECARLAQQHFIPGHSVAGPHFAQQLTDAIRAMK